MHAVRACLVIGCYNNPLGSCAPEAAKRELLALLARHDVPLIEDDIYGELFHGDQRPPPYKAFDRDDRVLLCGSFSKSITPGIRVASERGSDDQKRTMTLAEAFLAGADHIVVGRPIRNAPDPRAAAAAMQAEIANLFAV